MTTDVIYCDVCGGVVNPDNPEIYHQHNEKGTHMMTLDDQKLKICEKLPELIHKKLDNCCYWNDDQTHMRWGEEINWPTEGLQVCNSACEEYDIDCRIDFSAQDGWVVTIKSTTVQGKHLLEAWLECLCRVWYPERFE